MARRRMTLTLETEAVQALVRELGSANRSEAIGRAITVALVDERLSVIAAVDQDISHIARGRDALAGGALAAAARSLARSIDDIATSASAKASCVARLRETLDDLRQLATRAELEEMRKHAKAVAAEPDPAAAKEGNPISDLKARREARLERGTTS